MQEKSQVRDDEISLKDLISKIQEFFREVLKYWYIVFLLVVFLSGYMFYKVYKQPKRFEATLTFMVNEDEGGAMGGLGGIAASLGFGGGSNSEFNLDKIHALLKSRNIIQKGLFSKVVFKKKEDYFANHIIELYKLRDKWKERSAELGNFEFKNNDFEKFTTRENSILKQLYGKVVGSSREEGMLTSNIDDRTGIMTMKIKSLDPNLSINLVDTLYSELSRFYINKTIEKQKQNYELTKSKVDSIRTSLNSLQFRLLKFQDSQRNITLGQYKAREFELQRELQASIFAYGEAAKQLEIAGFALETKMPFIQSIDKPIPPLFADKNTMTYIKKMIIGGFLGAFLSISFIIGRKIIRDAMREE